MPAQEGSLLGGWREGTDMNADISWEGSDRMCLAMLTDLGLCSLHLCTGFQLVLVGTPPALCVVHFQDVHFPPACPHKASAVQNCYFVCQGLKLQAWNLLNVLLGLLVPILSLGRSTNLGSFKRRAHLIREICSFACLRSLANTGCSFWSARLALVSSAISGAFFFLFLSFLTSLFFCDLTSTGRQS